MKNLVYTKSAFLFLGLICFCLTACKKNNSIYYDYVNTEQTFNGSALAYLKAQPAGTFDPLLLVLDRNPELQDSLTRGNVTFFAPVNKNFEAAIKYLNIKRKADGNAPIYLSNADNAELAEMLSKYIIKGNKTTDDYKKSTDGLVINSIINDYPMHVKYVKQSASGYIGGGPATLEFSDTFGSIFSVDWITTTTNAVNIKTNNAVINILTPIHNFGFNEFTERLDK